MPVKQRQVVVVHKRLSAEQSFSFNLNLRFVPTQAIIRSISYLSTTGLTNSINGILYPWSNGEVGDVIIDNLTSQYISNPGTIFHLDNAGYLMNGDVKFSIRQLTNSQITNNLAGDLSITIEFLQEEYPKPSPLASEMKQLISVLSNVNKPRDVYPFDNIDRGVQPPTADNQPSLPESEVSDATLMEGEGDDASQDKKKNNPLMEI